MLRTRKSRRGRHGAAMIEFMVLLPFWCTALFGALEFGQIFQERLGLTNAAREGIRRIAGGDPTTTAVDAMRNAAPQLGLLANQVAVEYSTDEGVTWSAVANNGTG